MKSLQKLFFVGLLIWLCVFHVQAMENSMVRVVSGEDVKSINEYPYVGLLFQVNDQEHDLLPSCGVALITNSWAVTAAHCVYNTAIGGVDSPENYRVSLGSTHLSVLAQQAHNVQTIVVNPKYNPSNNYADIALLQLDTPSLQLPVQITTSTEEHLQDGDAMYVLGWGATAYGLNMSEQLQIGTVLASNKIACFLFYREQFDSSVHHCAGDTGQDACGGDSGGPLIRKSSDVHILVGIVSYGNGCAEERFPGVYTAITPFYTWIRNEIGNYAGQGNPVEVNERVYKIRTFTDGHIVSDSIKSGEAHLYELVNARNVSLRNTSGDADLFIVNGDLNVLSLESMSCASESSDQVDACVISSSPTKQIAIVYGYGESVSSYQITKNDDLVDSNGLLILTSTNTASGCMSLVSVLIIFIVRISRRETLKVGVDA